FELLEPYQMQRVATLMSPAADPQGAGYNSAQALIAVGSGGFDGTGLFQGEQTHGRFVPEQHTDFIFTVAGEELGFVGAMAIIALMALILWRVLRIGLKCDLPYPRLICVGVATWFGFQSFINIGMCLGLMPVTGIPLPFVSYGGTALLANMFALGLVLGVHARSRGCEWPRTPFRRGAFPELDPSSWRHGPEQVMNHTSPRCEGAGCPGRKGPLQGEGVWPGAPLAPGHTTNKTRGSRVWLPSNADFFGFFSELSLFRWSTPVLRPRPVG